MHTRLYIPPRTRLETVWRTVTTDGEVQWEVFTSCKDRNAPYQQMVGTALVLCADGLAMRHTEYGDGVTPVMLHVMPRIEDK